ncbi:MAG: class I SAM-dependent methyltransferase [Bacteroidales bacterium]|nr:class I SAM-dependent methyltransferase [Bacteroidales bacterium]
MNLRESIFRAWYWYVNKKDKHAEILFMNYGYEDKRCHVSLSREDEANRYSIQLYHHLTSSVELAGKDILEIGCGRGGGLAYTVRTFNPASAQGVDLDKVAISFCNRHYPHENLNFMRGDAQKLSIEDNTFDVILNVESSHRYPDMKAFLTEVRRLLRPGGYFLYTDFRYPHEMDILKDQLQNTGMEILKEEEITPNIVRALDLDDMRRRSLVKKLAPRLIQKIALNFAGTVGSATYNQFASGEYVYFSYIIRKNK